jgi:hypothetical protein
METSSRVPLAQMTDSLLCQAVGAHPRSEPDLPRGQRRYRVMVALPDRRGVTTVWPVARNRDVAVALVREYERRFHGRPVVLLSCTRDQP